MIYESSYWKEPLLDTARWLVSVRLGERTHERTFVRIESEIFTSFYAVRKLFDTLKVSDRIKKATTELEWHPNRRSVHHMNSKHLDLLYDLKTTKKEVRDVVFLCNQFVHSFVFTPYEENRRIGGFFVSSDRDKNKKLYRVHLEQVVKLLRIVGRDHPASLCFRFNHDSGVHETRIE